MAELMNSGRDDEESQQLVITFAYNHADLLPLRDLEARLQQTLDRHDVGVADGHSIAADLSDGALFFIGRDADALFRVIQPVLQEADFMEGALARLYDGPPGDPDVTERQFQVRPAESGEG